MKETAKPVLVGELLHFPLTFMNRLSEMEFVVSKLVDPPTSDGSIFHDYFYHK